MEYYGQGHVCESLPHDPRVASSRMRAGGG
jgi:hypothetical protein